jgi:hypothetical protein
VKALSDSPAALDLFMWLSYRCFVAKGEEVFRSTVRLIWPHKSAQPNMPGRAGSEKSREVARYRPSALAEVSGAHQP